MILLILSTCAAHAQATGQPIDESQIDAAIGFISDMNEHGMIKGFTNLDVNKAIAYLIKLRDAHGVVNANDVNNFGQEAVRLANGAIKGSEEIVKQARLDGQGSEYYNYCLDIMNKGADFVSYSIQKTNSGEVVKLGIK